MSKIIDNFEQKLNERNLPMTKREIKNNQILFNGAFRISEDRTLPFGIVFDARDQETVDFQVLYNRVAYIENFDTKGRVLEFLNDLNEMRSGYYRFCVRDDGEIYLRLLAKTSQDIQAAYEMMVMGGSIARGLIPEIEEFLADL